MLKQLNRYDDTNGILYFQRVRYGLCVRIFPWDKFRVEKLGKCGWEEFNEVENLSFSQPILSNYQNTNHPINRWTATLPKSILQCIENIVYKQLSVLTAIKVSGKYGEELFLDSPHLFVLIVKRMLRNNISFTELLGLSRLKRKELISQFYLKADRACIALFKKLDRNSVFRGSDFERLEKIICSKESLASLQHYPTVTPNSLLLVCEYPKFSQHAKFIRDKELQIDADPWEYSSIMNQARETFILGGKLNIQQFKDRFKACKNINGLATLKEEWDNEYLRRKELERVALNRQRQRERERQRERLRRLALERPDTYYEPAIIRSLEQKALRDLREQPGQPHNTTFEPINKLALKVKRKRGSGVFPNPPIPGRPGYIEPIRNLTALKDVAKRQNNCLSSTQYRRGCLASTMAIYKVHRPSLGVLQVKISHLKPKKSESANGMIGQKIHLCLNEFRLANNHPATKNDLSEVIHWWCSETAKISHLVTAKINYHNLAEGNLLL